MSVDLLKLLAANRGRGVEARVVKGFKPVNYDPDGDGDQDEPGLPDDDEATVYVYDVIGDWGVGAESFVKAVSAIKAKTIHLRINSPGGDVMAARAMMTALRNHSATVVAHVDGLSASAASFLMLAADEIEITDGAFVMIHNPSTVAWGDAREMRKTAALLDKVRDASANDYAARTGKSYDELVAMMDAETWMTAQEAVAGGFADRVVDGAKPQQRFDLSVYDNAPAALTAPPAEANCDAELEAARARQLRLASLYARQPA
ncbi:ATP-dependent Clp protease protease subunit [Rhodoblastus acidophilus]|uniref:head maturation protease, ClpP-related n=1 Tax=Rhodoblastus acidophilus TaxID=1074 RepID=UPI002224D214|nr:head maturation protease, ClpP-related [Rhodoblastus acidophilus]MCW2315305.1 ATP-dependent Clp protease protease subunit [Rhodoblastus acidophilus]